MGFVALIVLMLRGGGIWVRYRRRSPLQANLITLTPTAKRLGSFQRLDRAKPLRLGFATAALRGG